MEKHTRSRGDPREGRAIPRRPLGRAVWLTLALLFLCLAALVLWLMVRTRVPARGGIFGLWPGTAELGQNGTAREQEVASGRIDPYPLTPGMSRQEWEAAGVIPADNPQDGLSGEAASDSQNTKGERLSTEATEATTVKKQESDPDANQDIVYYRHKNDRMEIALSFDDGPHPRYTPEILSILEEYGVTATFFMVGENVTYYPEVAKAVIAAGHEVGNHSFSHRRLSCLSESEVRREIGQCEEAIASVGEYRPHLLRPPEGCMNAVLRRLSGEMDYRLILWDIDTRDWAHTAPEVIARNVLDHVEAGDIILMHDYIGHDSPTPEALRLVLPALLRKGYHFVTVSQLIDGA